MRRRCPRCGSFKTRRSALRTFEPRHLFYSPYRCHDCEHRFWVVSRNTYYVVGIVGVALAAVAATWGLQVLLATPEPVRSALPSPAFADTLKRAEANDANAQYAVAMMYSAGDGTAKNETEAKKWLERAAAKGQVAAEYELGIALRDGRGTVQDYESAAKWIQQAAEGGHPQAQLALGIMYRSGNGVTANNAKAYTWFNLAAANGVSEAATLRDAVLSRLSPQEVAEAQAEARRLSSALPGPSDPARH